MSEDYEDTIIRSHSAQAVLDNPEYKRAFEEIRTALIAKWGATRSGDEKLREDLWRSLKLLESLKKQLETIVTGGVLARDQLAKIDEESRLRKLFGT